MSDYTLSYTGEEVNGLLNTVNSNHAAWDSISQVDDYIVAQGTSGDWTWEKWNSGRAICYGLISLSSTWHSTMNTCLTAYAFDGSYSLPFTFASSPKVHATFYYGTHYGWGTYGAHASTSAITTVVWFGDVWNSNNAYADADFDTIVIGRWK